MAEPRVSIVILSYNRPEELAEALASAVAQTVRDREIVVVDNPSPASERIAAIVAAHPEARLISTSANLGFAGGINVAWRAARGRFVYLSEDDIVLAPECVERLAAFAEREPDCGMCAGAIYDRADGRILSAGGEVALRGVFRATLRGRGERDAGQFGEPADVAWLPAGAALARRDVLDLLGGFRDEFFMYFEDVEICVRIRALGFRVCYVPGATVEHIPTRRSAAPPPDVEFHKLKNLYTLYALHAPARAWPAFAARYGVVEGFRSLAASPERFRLHLRAWGWVLARLPRLLGERWALRRMAGEPGGGR
jgi:GT2 family glycosyltransferase